MRYQILMIITILIIFIEFVSYAINDLLTIDIQKSSGILSNKLYIRDS